MASKKSLFFIFRHFYVRFCTDNNIGINFWTAGQQLLWVRHNIPMMNSIDLAANMDGPLSIPPPVAEPDAVNDAIAVPRRTATTMKRNGLTTIHRLPGKLFQLLQLERLITKMVPVIWLDLRIMRPLPWLVSWCYNWTRTWWARDGCNYSTEVKKKVGRRK